MVNATIYDLRSPVLLTAPEPFSPLSQTGRKEEKGQRTFAAGFQGSLPRALVFNLTVAFGTDIGANLAP